MVTKVVRIEDVVVGSPGWEKARSDLSAFRDDTPSMTEQAHVASCDINTMMARYEKNGTLPRTSDGQPFFGDFTSVPDFHSAQMQIAAANEAFAQLPASVRKRFENDPGQLLSFLDDERNREEAIGLGLIDKPVVAPQAPSPTASETKPSA